MGLTVHHLQVSQSERVVFLCEELGLDYTLKNYARAPVLAPADYKALHAIGAAPVIEDDKTGEAAKIGESEACLLYIDEVYNGGKLQIKAGEKGFGEYLYWFCFTNGTLQPAMGRVMTFKFAGTPDDNPTVVRMAQKVTDCLEFANQRLGASEYVGGARFTLADIMLTFTLTTMRKFYELDLTPYPNIVTYLKKISERPGHQKALQKGDPDLEAQEITGAKAPLLFFPLRK